jgi:hypothetical protein
MTARPTFKPDDIELVPDTGSRFEGAANPGQTVPPSLHHEAKGAFGPGIDTTHWHRRQSSEKIVGVRLSFSMDAKALITAQRSKESARVFRLPSRPSSGESRCLKQRPIG